MVKSETPRPLFEQWRTIRTVRGILKFIQISMGRVKSILCGVSQICRKNSGRGFSFHFPNMTCHNQCAQYPGKYELTTAVRPRNFMLRILANWTQVLLWSVITAMMTFYQGPRNGRGQGRGSCLEIACYMLQDSRVRKIEKARIRK